MLNNIINYYIKITNMALINLKAEKGFQFKRHLTNNTPLELIAREHFEKINNSKEAQRLINNYSSDMKNMHVIAQKEYNSVLLKLKATNDPKLKQKILSDYANNGVHGFKASNGAMWGIESYSSMYTTQLNNDLIRLSVIENNTSGKVKVSSHGSKCTLCKSWEGKTLTLEELEKAKSSGLFHVGCKHYVTETN